MATLMNRNGINVLNNGTFNQTQRNDFNGEGNLVPLGDNERNSPNDDRQQQHNDGLDGGGRGLPPAHPERVDLDNSDDSPGLDIIICNVVCSFSVRCHLDLREIALHGSNVEYRRENGLVRMRLRKPCTLASISSSGKVTCTGAASEEDAKKAARRYARSLEKLGFKVRFNNYRVVNVLGTCTLPWAVKITNFSTHYKDIVSYEPEIQPGVIYKLHDLRATLRIFSTGSVTVTAPSISNVQAAIERVYPLVYEFRRERSEEELIALRARENNHHSDNVQEEVVEVEDNN